jgi:Ca-activated chloride channel homolog
MPPAVGWVAAAARGAGRGPAMLRRRMARPAVAVGGAPAVGGACAMGGARAVGGAAVPGVAGSGEASRLERARRQLADEAAALRAAQGAPEADRVRLLADLGTRIEALLACLAADFAVGGQDGLAQLAGLAGKLRACDEPGPPRGGELDTLMAEAIRLLTEFGARTGPAVRPAFWKRSR